MKSIQNLKLFNFSKLVIGMIILGIVATLMSCDDDDDNGGDNDLQDIVDVAIEAGYTRLADALTEANLVSTLRGPGPFTVFAPTNEAFETAGVTSENNFGGLTTQELSDILTYHVVPANVTSSDLMTGEVASVQGALLSIDADNLTVNDVSIINPFDVEASNGIIHTIGTVLTLPEAEPTQNIVQLAQSNNDLSDLVTALLLFPDLVDVLSDATGTYTVFAPTNEAFDALLAATGQTQLTDIPESVIRRVLEYHVIVGQAAFAEDLNDGDELDPFLDDMNDVIEVGVGMSVTIDNATVISPDLTATNGVVHVIDGVLTPDLETSIVNTVVQPAYFNVNFTILTDAVVEAELLETLINTDEGTSYTLFAPDNAAFAEIDVTSVDDIEDAALEGILLYHVLSGETFASQLPNTEGAFATGIPTLSEEEFYLTNNANGVFINGNSQVTAATNADDALDFSNGVVHLISRTLLPAEVDVVGIAQDAGFTELAAALTEAGLVGALQETGPFTVFAPTNEAFTDLYDFLDVADATEVDDATLEAVLLYHVIGGNDRIFSSDLTDGIMPATLASGDMDVTFTVNVGMDGVTITDNDSGTADAMVTGTDNLATNGVVHIIDAVILPIEVSNPN